MLCNICNDIYEDDELKCSNCNGLLHFDCAALRKSAFRKMSKNVKQKWCCSKCKYAGNDSNSKMPNIIPVDNKEDPVLTNETFRNLINSVNFMSDKFDVYGNQMQELVKSIKKMREENKILKEENKHFLSLKYI